MVHSSLSSIGWVDGGGATVIQSLQDLIGQSGTLVMPSHSWGEVNAGMRTFSLKDTASCVGAIPELFRQSSGVVRSIHPTHSVAARGDLAKWIVRDHESAGSPCGFNTPYAKLMEVEATVLLLGVGLERNTLFHTLETMCNVDYCLEEMAANFTVDSGGDSVSKKLSFRLHQQGISRNYPSFEAFLRDRDVLSVGRVGHARVLSFNAGRFRDVLLPALSREPTLFLG